MPDDASGNYSLPAGTIVSNGETILPSQHNPAMQDIAAALTNRLNRQGTAPMLAALKMGGFKITGMADATDPQDAVTKSQAVMKAGDTMTGGLSISGLPDGVGTNYLTLTENASASNPFYGYMRAFVEGGSYYAVRLGIGRTGFFDKFIDIRDNGNLYVGGTSVVVNGASYNNNGDIEGSVWGAWGSNYAFEAIGLRIEARVGTRAVADAECQHDSGTVEFGFVAASFDSIVDLPGPYVLTGLRTQSGTGSIYLRGKTIRNQ